MKRIKRFWPLGAVLLFFGLVALAIYKADQHGWLGAYFTIFGTLCLIGGCVFRGVLNDTITGWLDADPPYYRVQYEAHWPKGPLPHEGFNRWVANILFLCALACLLNPLTYYRLFQAPDMTELNFSWNEAVREDPSRIREVPEAMQSTRMCERAVAQDPALIWW